MSMQTISIMDYIGTFAFALSGAYLAIRYELRSPLPAAAVLPVMW